MKSKIFVSLITVFIVLTFARSLFSLEIITFSSFLDMISKIPYVSFDLSSLSFDLSFLPDFLRWLLEPLKGILVFLSVLSGTLTNIVLLFTYIISWLFGTLILI